MNDLTKLDKFATRYANAWCPLVARCKIDNDGLIVESKGHFDSVE